MAIVTEREIESEGPRAPLLDRPLRGLLTWERALGLLALLLLLALVSRFWMLGERALHHDESLHAVYSYYLFDAGNYQHQPMMHGPLLFHLTAFSYWLFGDSDFTARLVPALLGIFLVWAPWKFRAWLGTTGALATSALMLISPVMLYYSRFIREDIFAAAWTVIIVYGMWAYLRGGRLFHLYVMVVGWALLFSQKEISFMLAFIFWLYLAGATLWAWWRARRAGRAFAWREERAWALLVVLGALLLPFLTAVIMHLPTVINNTFNTALPIWDPGAVGGNSETSVYNSAVNWPDAFKWRAYLTVAALAALGVLVAARFWRLREYLVAAALFFGIVLTLHTTFLTNPHGIGSGIVGALGYWIEQHDVARGEQPWFYYAMLLPLYEFLPLAIVAVGGPLLFWKWGQGRPAPRGPGAPEAGGGWMPFLLWWTIAAFALFSFAGEKMPWLLVHLALPLIFLAGSIVGRTLGALNLRRLRRPDAALIGLLVLTLVLALTNLVVMLLDGVAPFRGMDEMSLLATARWLLTALFLLGAGWGASVLAERFTRAEVAQIAALALLIPLVAATVRFSLIASFRNADTANEPLIFVQTTPAMTRFMRDLEDLSERLTGGREIAVAYDSEASWPFEWYLRHYPNRFFYGSAPQSYGDSVRNADVVIAGDANWQNVQPLVTGYVTHEYKMRWWFPEAYKKLTERVDPVTGGVTQDKGLVNVLSRLRGFAAQPQYRADFLDFLLNRRVKDPLGGMGIRIYYKPEIAARVWGATPSTLPVAPVEDDLATVEAARVVEGMFEMPRAVAALPDGRVAVADTRANAITILAADGSVDGRFGSFGAGPGQFNEPWGIAAAPDGTLYIADTWNHRVVHMSAEGETLGEFGGGFTDSGGLAEGAEGLFWGPRGVAVGPNGEVWVTDTGNARVQRFSADGSFVAQFGGRGAGAGQLNEPVGIAVAPDGTVWIADTWNQRIQGFDGEGIPLVQIPLTGWAGQGVDNKPAIAASGDRLWVTDPEQSLVIEFDRAGTRLRSWGGFGSGPAQLALPGGLALRDGELWVADAGNARVAIFETE